MYIIIYKLNTIYISIEYQSFNFKQTQIKIKRLI